MKTTLLKTIIGAIFALLIFSAFDFETASGVALAVAPIAMRRKNGMSSRPNPYQKPTPQAKIIESTSKFGATGIKKQQGSTIVKYDILPFAEGVALPVTTFTFFQDAQTRQFPFTNLTDGKLQVGEAIALERMYIFIVTQLTATGEFTNVQSIGDFAIHGADLSVFNFMISNSQVIKPTPLLSATPAFNRYAFSTNYNVFHFETDIVIPPMIEFALNLKMPSITVPVSATNTYYIGCTIEGTGAILAPRATF
jgi:hypothetical protein